MEAINRYINYNDWITTICIFALILLVLSKKTSHYHFKNFLLLIASDKYIKTHKDDTSKKRLHYILLIFQAIIIPLLIYTCLLKLNYIKSTNWLLYAKITGVYILFYLFKYLLERGFGYLIKQDILLSNYLFQKQTYFNYIACFIYPILLLTIYSLTVKAVFIYIFIVLILFLLLTSVILVITNNRKLFYIKPYYFILYLCAFEIAPYILSFIIITDAI